MNKTKGEALHAFFSKFGLPVYAANNVPDDVEPDYLTYEMKMSAWGDGETNITVNLWFYTESEAVPNQKAQELSDAFGLGGVLLSCDGGAIWLKRGSPFCQALTDPTDRNKKRRYINVTAEYLTLS